MQSAPRGETRQACALCYNRKIKCIDDGDSCRACNEHQTECRPRVSRRQGRPRGQSKHVFRTHTERPEASNASNSTGSSTPSEEARPTLASMPTDVLGIDPSKDVTFPTALTPHTPTSTFSRQDSLNFLSTAEFGLDTDLMSTFPQDLMWTNLPTSQPLGPDSTAMTQDWPASSALSDAALAQLADVDDGGPSSALYDAYVETDTTLSRVWSGAQNIGLEDLKDEGLVTRLLSQVAEAATTEAHDICGATPQRRSSFALLAMLAIRKVCALAEHSITVMLSSSLTFGHSIAPADPDRIAAMLRVDQYLVRLNAFVTSFTRAIHTFTLADNSSAFKIQDLLRNIHTRIRTKVDNMLSTWES